MKPFIGRLCGFLIYAFIFYTLYQIVSTVCRDGNQLPDALANVSILKLLIWSVSLLYLGVITYNAVVEYQSHCYRFTVAGVVLFNPSTGLVTIPWLMFGGSAVFLLLWFAVHLHYTRKDANNNRPMPRPPVRPA